MVHIPVIPRWSVTWLKVCLFSGLVLVSLQSPLFAGPVTLNGYFEGEYVSDKNRRPAPWDLWNPKNYLELKFSAHPFPNSEAYVSINMLSNANYARIYFNQAHLTLRGDRKEINFFAREDRFYLDSPLLYLVNTDRARDDAWGPKAEGVRFDFWQYGGFYGTGIVYKFRTFQGEGYMGRIRKEFGTRAMLGLLYLKKDWHTGTPPTYNEVVAFQGQVRLYGSTYLRWETATSTHPVIRDPSRDDRRATEIELRSIHWKNFNIAGSVFHYGINFTDEFSNKFNPSFDHEFDRKGYSLEVVYLFPTRAINLIYKTRRFRTRYQHPILLDEPFTVVWNYGEIYTEFIGGVNAKVALDSWKDYLNTWTHLLFEVIGENRRMRVKLQYKIKDLGVNRHGQQFVYSIGERHLIGLELRVNLTDHLQFYGRGVVGMGVYRNWQSLFLQLAYRRFQNTEIYLEYGEPSHTDNDLVNDFDVSENPYQKIVDRVKVLVKFWF